MRYRCFNPNHGDYRYYGAKGIEVCKSWLVLENFFHDMHETWFPGATIDRINSRGNYELTNCQWLTALANNIKK